MAHLAVLVLVVTVLTLTMGMMVWVYRVSQKKRTFRIIIAVLQSIQAHKPGLQAPSSLGGSLRRVSLQDDDSESAFFLGHPVYNHHHDTCHHHPTNLPPLLSTLTHPIHQYQRL